MLGESVGWRVVRKTWIPRRLCKDSHLHSPFEILHTGSTSNWIRPGGLSSFFFSDRWQQNSIDFHCSGWSMTDSLQWHRFNFFFSLERMNLGINEIMALITFFFISKSKEGHFAKKQLQLEWLKFWQDVWISPSQLGTAGGFISPSGHDTTCGHQRWISKCWGKIISTLSTGWKFDDLLRKTWALKRKILQIWDSSWWKWFNHWVNGKTVQGSKAICGFFWGQVSDDISARHQPEVLQQ